MCEETMPNNQKSNFVDKLLLQFPFYGLRDVSPICRYSAWLHPEGLGVFVKMPSTGSFLITNARAMNNKLQDPTKFVARCAMTWHHYELLVADMVEDDKFITIHYQFPDDLSCSNAHFNKDINGVNPPDHSLLPKTKLLKDFIKQPSADDLGLYQMCGCVYFEMEVFNEGNISSTQQDSNGVDTLSDLINNMAVGT